VIILTRLAQTKKQKFLFAPIKRLDFETLPDEVRRVSSLLNERVLLAENWTLTGDRELIILEKMRNVGVPLGEYVNDEIYYGVKTGYNDAFVIDRTLRDKLIDEDPKSAEIIKPFVVGDDVRKYRINTRESYLIFTRHGIEISKYKVIKKYLTRFRERLTPRPKDWKGEWHGRKPGSYEWYEIQDSVDYFEKIDQPKIVYPDIAKESRFAFDTDGLFFGNTVYFIPLNDLYLLALLNSKLIYLYFKRIATALGDPDKGGRLRWFQQDIVKIPIHRINFDDPAEKSAHDEIVKLVEKMLKLQKERQSVSPEEDYDLARNLDRQIAEVDAAIDGKVYELYGLTEEEIRIVEGK
jgi:hypothetical protein